MTKPTNYTSAQKLNSVLRTLNHPKSEMETIPDIVDKVDFEGDAKEIHLIVDKLRKDGYIECMYFEIREDGRKFIQPCNDNAQLLGKVTKCFHITFDGRVFIKKGGYPSTWYGRIWYWYKTNLVASIGFTINAMYVLFVLTIKIFYCPCVNVIPLPSYQQTSKDTLKGKNTSGIPLKDTIKASRKYVVKDSLRK